MNRMKLAVFFLLFISNPILVQSEEIEKKEIPSTSPESGIDTSITNSRHHIGGMSGKHKGKCQHGKGHGGKRHGSARHSERNAVENDRLEHRLDLIEARLAKIETMLEALLRR